jgi:tetratricopeptide (TPR) repeat protein
MFFQRRLRVVILPFEFLLNFRICDLAQVTRMNRVTRLNNWLRPVCLAVFFVPSHASCQPQSELAGLYDQARGLEKHSDYAAAERIYLKALELAPGNPETLKRLGIVEQTEMRFEESITHFKQALSRDAQYLEVNFFLGVSYFGQNDFANAIQSFQQELATAKPHRRCRYYLGLAFQSAGRTEEAIAAFNGAVTQTPNDADSLYELARIYKNASIHVIDRLRILDPDSFQLHALLGEMDADGEHYTDAIKEYQAALAKRPDATGIHFAIGVAYWIQRQFEPAKIEFLEAYKENPNDSLTNLYLGDIAVQDREFGDAMKYLDIAEKGQVELFRVHLLLGECYRGQHQLEKAKAEFLTAVKADSNAAEVHYLLAQVYQELKDPEASTKEFAEFERLSRLDKERSLENGPQN